MGLGSPSHTSKPLLMGFSPLPKGFHHFTTEAMCTNVVLSSLLAKITKTPFNLLQNSSVENNLISGLQITTSTNRVTRILLGVVHAIATAKLALKGQKDLNKNIKENDGKITFGGLLWQTYNLFGVLLLGLVAGTWLSTGYYGQ